MTYKAAAVQLNSQPDLQHNIEACQKWVEQAAEQGADFISLPENFFFLGDMSTRFAQADEIYAAVYKYLPQWAINHKVFIQGGGFPASAGRGKWFNRSVIFNPTGEEVARYDKIHLFDITLSEEHTYRESKNVAYGSTQVNIVSLENLGNWGQTICYDVRFPELYRQYQQEGVEVLTLPAAFTDTTGEAHWFPLLRARAIENLSYIIAAAQTGTHGKSRNTFGHACIIDPWGRVVDEAGQEEGIAIAEIDLEQQAEIRSKLPALTHRRLKKQGFKK